VTALRKSLSYLRGDETAPDNAFEVLSEIVSWANKVKSGEIANMADDASVEVVLPPQGSARPEVPAAPAAELEQQATLRVPVKYRGRVVFASLAK